MRAAIDAGYSPRSAHVTGSRLLKKCEIKKLIISSREKNESERIIEKRRVLKWLRAYIDADIAEVFDDLNNIKPVKNWPLILRSSGINIKIRNSNDGEVKYIETYKKNIMKCIELYGQHDFVRAYEAPNTRCPGKNRNIDRWILGLMGALESESDGATNLNWV
jgi:phage terminase small subunit